MFRMRQEHLDSFDRAAWRHFVEVARAELRRHHANRFASATDAELEAFIRQQQIHAEEYDLESEFAVLNFLHLVATLGSDFAAQPHYENVVDALNGDDDENERAEAALAMALSSTLAATEVPHG